MVQENNPTQANNNGNVCSPHLTEDSYLIDATTKENEIGRSPHLTGDSFLVDSTARKLTSIVKGVDRKSDGR